MVYDPNKTDRWSVRDIRRVEADQRKREINLMWGILAIIALLVLGVWLLGR